MEKKLVALNETNILKVYAMFRLSDQKKLEIDPEEKGDVQWIIDNWDMLSVSVNGPQVQKCLIELSEENIVKMLGGYQIGLQSNIKYDDIPAYVIEMFDYLEIKNREDNKDNNIYLHKNNTLDK